MSPKKNTHLAYRPHPTDCPTAYPAFFICRYAFVAGRHQPRRRTVVPPAYVGFALQHLDDDGGRYPDFHCFGHCLRPFVPTLPLLRQNLFSDGNHPAFVHPRICQLFHLDQPDLPCRRLLGDSDDYEPVLVPARLPARRGGTQTHQPVLRRSQPVLGQKPPANLFFPPSSPSSNPPSAAACY